MKMTARDQLFITEYGDHSLSIKPNRTAQIKTTIQTVAPRVQTDTNHVRPHVYSMVRNRRHVDYGFVRVEQNLDDQVELISTA